MEPIIDYIRRRVREAGPRRYAAIAQQAGVGVALLRKLGTGERDNPRVQTIQPLLDYFQAIDRGECELPPPAIDPRYLPQPQEKAAA
jgi:predicted transcriptional regulator